VKSVPRILLVAALTAALGVCEVSGQVNAPRIEHLLVMRDNTLYVMESGGANRQKVATEVTSAALSPDGSLVAYAVQQGIRVFDLRSAKISTLVNGPSGAVRDITWSPTQEVVAYSNAVDDRGEILYLAAYPPNGLPARSLGPTYGGISFSKDGNFILHARASGNSGTLEKSSVETGRTETLFAAKTLIERASYAPDDSQIAFLLTDEGPETADDSEPSCVPPSLSLWILASNSKIPIKVNLKPLGNPDINQFSWSPKGDFLVFDSGQQQCDFPGDHGDVFVISPDLKTAFKLSKHRLSRAPVFSPDGEQVLFGDFTAYDSNHGPNLMIGDLRTRAVKPFPGQLPPDRDSFQYDQIVDWK
jgi:Tol biopolymer transport system component